MKKIGLGLGILVVLLVGALLTIPSFLNWNEYKDQIEKTASDYSGREVKIKGDISLSLLPTSALSVKDVTVSNLEGGRAEYMLSLKSLDIKVSFPSVISYMFGGKIKVEKFILVDAIVALEVLKDGRANWELAGAGTVSNEEKTSSADISLDKFQIVNGQISFEDMVTGQMELLRKMDANVKVKSIDGPFEVEGRAKYQGLDAELNINLGKNRPGKKVPLSLAMALLNGNVQVTVSGGVILNGKDSSFTGKLDVKAKDASDLSTLFDRFRSSNLTSRMAVNQAISLETEVAVAADKVAFKDINIQLGQSRGQGSVDISFGEKINFLGDLSVNKLDIDPLLARFAADAKTTPDSLIENVSPGQTAPQADILKRLSGKLDFKLGALQYNGKIASQIALTMQAENEIIEVTSAQARMPGGSVLAFQGKITSGDKQPALTGDISVNSSNLRGLLSWLNVDVEKIPSGQLGQFSYKSAVNVTTDLLQLYGIVGKLDSLSFTGGISQAFSVRPSYGLSLEIQNLNIDSYLIPRKPDEPIDFKGILSSLDQFDANYKIGFSNLSLDGIRIKSGQMNGLLLGGKLEAKVIKLSDHDGMDLVASGHGQNFSSKPEIDLKISLNAKSLVTVQRLLRPEDQIDLSKFDQVSLDGSLSSTLDKMDVNFKSKIGLSKLNIKGVIRSATLKEFPEFGSADLELEGQSASLAMLIDQWDIPMTRPQVKDDRPVMIKGRIIGNSNLVNIEGKLNIADGEVGIKGRIKSKEQKDFLDLALEVTGAETRSFIRGLGVDFEPSKDKLGPIVLKMAVTGSGDQYAFNNISGDVGPIKLSGAGTLDMGRKQPYFDFNLVTGSIPVNDFMKKNPQTIQAKNTKASGQNYGQWSKTPFDLSLLSSYVGKAKISAASLSYNKYIFENPLFEMVLNKGILSINNLSGRLFGGDVTMTGSFGGSGKPTMNMALALKNASLAEATKVSAGIAPVTGFFDLAGKFTGEGISQYDIISSLSGTGNITAQPGLIHGIDIPALSKQLSQLSSENALQGLLVKALSGGQTSYKGGTSIISAKDGMVQLSPFDIELEGAKSNVNMAVNLTKWNIQSNGRLSLVDHPNAPPIEVNIMGDVSQPKVNYNTDRLKKYVGAKIASSLLQKTIGKEGGLEGLFGTSPAPAETSTSKPETDVTTSPQATVPDKKENPQPVEEFGRKLLQKLFEKDKQTPPAEEKKPDNSTPQGSP